MSAAWTVSGKIAVLWMGKFRLLWSSPKLWSKTGINKNGEKSGKFGRCTNAPRCSGEAGRQRIEPGADKQCRDAPNWAKVSPLWLNRITVIVSPLCICWRSYFLRNCVWTTDSKSNFKGNIRNNFNINLFALTLRAGNPFLSQIDNNMLLYTSWVIIQWSLYEVYDRKISPLVCTQILSLWLTGCNPCITIQKSFRCP